MSSKVVTEAVVERKSDMSNQTATTSRTLTSNGVTGTIDLTDREAATFDNFVNKYLSKASEVAVSPATLREWGSENGFEVGTRGRLHASIAEAYIANLRGEDAASDESGE